MESGQHVQCAYSTYCMSMSHLKECLVDDSYCYVRCGLTSENTKNWKYSQASGGHMVAQRKAQQRIAVKKKRKRKRRCPRRGNYNTVRSILLATQDPAQGKERHQQRLSPCFKKRPMFLYTYIRCFKLPRRILARTPTVNSNPRNLDSCSVSSFI